MVHTNAAQLAAVVGALGAAFVLLARSRAILLAGLGLLAFAEAGLGYSRTSSFHARPTVLGLGVVALAVLAVAAVPLVRRPDLATPLVLAAAPFRLPLHFDRHQRFFVGVAHGGELGRLLLLYAVLAVVTAAFAFRVVRGAPVRALPPAIVAPAAAFVALAAVSLTWTSDLGAGTNLLMFFLLPFAVLVAIVGRAPFPAWLPRVLAIVAVALGCLFAFVGIVEAVAHRLLFFSSSVAVGNTYSSFFRVTSLFRDPSLYGRHLVLAMAVLVVALWLGRVGVLLAAGLLAFLFAGLYFSYSQSSFVALFVVTLLVAALVGDRRRRRLVLVGAVAAALLGAGAVAAVVQNQSVRRVTSDRSRRIDSASRVFRNHPVLGVGLGAQPKESQELARRHGPTGSFVSHTTPLTVASELGVLGLLAYLGLLAGAGKTIDLVRRRDEGFGLVLAAVFVALFTHSLFYSGFVEDPMTWFVLALASSYVVVKAGVTEAAAIIAPRPAATAPTR